MALLIDGYNLLHVSDIFAGEGSGTVLHRARLALLEFLAESFTERERAEITIVFDAAGAPPGLPRTLQHDRMTVRFARGFTDADALLEELIDQHAAPRSLTVVSSDHRVQRAARRRGSSFVDSDAWFRELKAARRAGSAADWTASTKPAADESVEQVAFWLRKFSEPLPTEKSRRIKQPPKAPNARITESKKKSEPRRTSSRKKRDANVNQKPIDDGIENPFPPGYGDDLLD